MKKLFTLSLLILTAFAFKANATIHIVLADNFFYAPATVTVEEGDTVRFQWVAGNHPTSSTTGDWTTFIAFPLNSGAPTFDLVMSDEGTYNYQCDFHAGLGMVGTIIVNPGAGCDASVAPQNPTTTNGASSATLSWDAVAGSVACQVKGTRITPPGPSPTVNITGSEPTSVNVPYAAAGAGTTWEWETRCACSTSPVIATPFSAPELLVIPAPRESDLKPSLSVFPNPADAQLFAGFVSEGGEVLMQIMSITGRVVQSRTATYDAGLQNEVFDLTELKTGIYFLQITEGTERETREFTVSH